MLQGPSESLTAAVARFAQLKGEPAGQSVSLADGRVVLPTFDFGNKRLVLCAAGSPLDVENAFNPQPASFNDPHLFEVVIAVDGLTRGFSKVLARGIRAVSVHAALADLVGLPAGSLDDQDRLHQQALQTLKFGDSYQVAALRLRIGDEAQDDALAWLDEALSWRSRRLHGRLLYLRAEAGKGKSTVFASLARQRLGTPSAPLTLYIPLRQVERGYVSWQGIAGIVGAVGLHATDLSLAAKAGLVAVLLDGLDEVAGRYDPTVVSEVLDIALGSLVSQHSLVAVSGRTTEATLLDKSRSIEGALELPAADSEAFKRYTATVVSLIAPSWPQIAERLPEPPLGLTGPLPTRPPTEAELGVIEEWIRLRFEEFGKEKSLFFVQSLAGIARTLQLRGNQPLVISGQPKGRCCVIDVCLLAASLACVREQDKVEPIAHDFFIPSAQLEVLTRFAVLSSSDPNTRLKLPKPNAEAQRIFKIDSLNQNEEFTAIVRQLQKHALLFAGNDSPAAGDWKPYFLSDWVRSVLLLRAWESTAGLPGQQQTTQRTAIARAQRAGLLFSVLLPEYCAKTPSALTSLVDAIVGEADNDSSEACSNYWALISGLDDSLRKSVTSTPKRLVEMADLSSLEFEALEFGQDFKCNLITAVGVAFTDCAFDKVSFSQCDLTRAEFEGCRFTETNFDFCDGPVVFRDCQFAQVSFRDTLSRDLPALVFEDCVFGEGCRIEQTRAPSTGDRFAPIARFAACEWSGGTPPVLEGEWLGFNGVRVDGLDQQVLGRVTPAFECLRRLLRPFFPSHIGDGGERQARGYIRLSAIGRGVVQPGAPTPNQLRATLESEGFASGGRADHVYAPWSSVLGADERGVALRNELLAFLRNGAVSPRVQGLLNRINHDATW